MKKLVLFFIVLIIMGLTACSDIDSTENVIFAVDEEQKKVFNTKIAEQLNINLWNYNEADIVFEQSAVPDENNPDFDSIYRASSALGFDIDGVEGMDAVAASVKISYSNNEEAGNAFFYFIGNELVCLYYMNASKVYSLSEIDVFADGFNSEYYEDLETVAEFDESEIKTPFDGYADMCIKSGIVGIIEDSKALFYKYTGEFKLVKEIDYGGEGLYPVDLSFDDDGVCAVLLGKKNAVQTASVPEGEQAENQGNDELSEESSFGQERLSSVKIVFVDEDFKTVFSDIVLDLGNYSSVDLNGEKLFAARGKSIDVFENNNGVFQKTKQYLLKQWIGNIKSADIAGNGKKEYIMTDSTNLYIYIFDDSPVLLWKTHLDMQSMVNSFYISDLNKDGVKEIYVSDKLINTSVKYALMPFGFKSFSTPYGSKYIPGDFDADGKDDYIKIDSMNDKAYICISK